MVGLAAGLKTLMEGDVLVVWKLDRLGRNLKHLVNTLQDLAKRNIGFKVIAGQGANIDTTTTNGRLIFDIFASLAEFEAELIRERKWLDLLQLVPEDVMVVVNLQLQNLNFDWHKPQ